MSFLKMMGWGAALYLAFLVGDGQTVLSGDLAKFVASTLVALPICAPLVYQFIRVRMFFKNNEVGTPEDVATSTGLSERQAARAIKWLVDGGKVKRILDEPQLFKSCENKVFKNAMTQVYLDID
jgi:hypothetical protein